MQDPAGRPRTSPAQFDLRRFNRFGLLGLADGVVLRAGTDFEIEIIGLETEDAADRLARLCELLAGMLKTPFPGGADATSRPLRQGFHRAAGA